MIRRLEFDFLRSVRHFVKRSPQKVVLGGSLAMMALYNIPKSACAGDNKGSVYSFIDSVTQLAAGNGNAQPNGGPRKGSDAISNLIDEFTPTLQKLGFGGLMGICTGVAMKRASNSAAAIIGACFVGLQGLSYMGYIKIDYGKVQRDAVKLVDVNRDGKLDTDDLRVYWQKFLDVLSYNLPGAGGFSAGVLIGLYCGN